MFPTKIIPFFGALCVLIPAILCLTLREEMFLTEEQQLAFNRFKALALNIITTEYMKNDLVLIKYFRFCEMNENKTYEHLKENLKWRLELGFEQLTEDEFTEHTRLFPFTIYKDKLGRAVFFLVFRYWDISAATTTPEQSAKLLKFMFRMIEQTYIKGVAVSPGRVASGSVILVDFKDTDLTKTVCPKCVPVLKELFNQMEVRWPGGLQFGYLVNAPTLLLPTIKVVKQSLQEHMQKLVNAYDDNDATWMPELLKFINADSMPAELYVKSQHPEAMAPAFSFFAKPPPVAMAPAQEELGKKAKPAIKTTKNKGSDDDDDGL